MGNWKKNCRRRAELEMRKLYVYFLDYEKVRTLFAQLTWSHFQKVLRVSDEKTRIFYLTETAEDIV